VDGSVLGSVIGPGELPTGWGVRHSEQRVAQRQELGDGPRGGRNGTLHCVDHPVHHLLDQRVDDVGLGVEVEVEGPLGHAGSLNDVAHGRPGHTLPCEDLPGGVDKVAASGFGIRSSLRQGPGRVS
jgi:hypothetical protein